VVRCAPSVARSIPLGRVFNRRARVKKNPADAARADDPQDDRQAAQSKGDELTQPLGADRVRALSGKCGMPLIAHRAMHDGAAVLHLETPLKLSDAMAGGGTS